MRPAVKMATKSDLSTRRPRMFGLPESPDGEGGATSPVSGDEKATVPL